MIACDPPAATAAPRLFTVAAGAPAPAGACEIMAAYPEVVDRFMTTTLAGTTLAVLMAAGVILFHLYAYYAALRDFSRFLCRLIKRGYRSSDPFEPYRNIDATGWNSPGRYVLRSEWMGKPIYSLWEDGELVDTSDKDFY